MLTFLNNLMEGLSEIPSFLFAAFFRMGVFSVIMWISLIFCALSWVMEKYDKPQEEARLKELKANNLRTRNLSRYAKY